MSAAFGQNQGRRFPVWGRFFRLKVWYHHLEAVYSAEFTWKTRGHGSQAGIILCV
jgi:hypothetical protein